MPPLAIAPTLDITGTLAPANDNEPMSTFLLVLRGQIAALTGDTLGDNPFKMDSPEGRCWTTGWLNMQVEIQDDGAASPALAGPAPRPAVRLQIVSAASAT